MSFRHERYIGLDILLKKWKNMSFRHERYKVFRFSIYLRINVSFCYERYVVLVFIENSNPYYTLRSVWVFLD